MRVPFRKDREEGSRLEGRLLSWGYILQRGTLHPIEKYVLFRMKVNNVELVPDSLVRPWLDTPIESKVRAYKMMIIMVAWSFDDVYRDTFDEPHWVRGTFKRNGKWKKPWWHIWETFWEIA